MTESRPSLDLHTLSHENLGRGAWGFFGDSLGFADLLHPLDAEFPQFNPQDLGLDGIGIDRLWVVGYLEAAEIRDRLGAVYEPSPERGLDLDRWDGLLVVALDVPESIHVTRTVLSQWLRKMNRKASGRPVVAVFRSHDRKSVSIGAIERVERKRAGTGDKLGKVSLLRDIQLSKPHQGQQRILWRLHLAETERRKIHSVQALEKHWRQAFDVQVLNKEFYEQLFHWYLWAWPQVKFPMPENSGITADENASRATLRFVTRMLFTWFLKERGLVPRELFDPDTVADWLHGFSKNGKTGPYHNAVLQNLFFACFNAEWRHRSFLPESSATGHNTGYLDHSQMRHRDLLKRPDQFLSWMQDVPMLNAGLFECLDRRVRHLGQDLGEERWDGFSNRTAKRALVPDELLWCDEHEVEVSGKEEKGTSLVRVKGLIPLLDSFVFTVEENTPDDQDVALDPELLGRVFENLLASVNPETRDTARKTTGSFYTPREVVRFMADQALESHLQRALGEAHDPELLRALFHGESRATPEQRDVLVKALSECKILDPACGSGAFPMGVLERMVELLRVLDPDNSCWKREQLRKAKADLEAARRFGDLELREKAVRSAEERITGIESSFGSASFEENYTRKLYLIEQCIHGVDIQPTAVQITLLRFFLTLLIEQRVDPRKENQGITPLPNLETKFVVANSLIPLRGQTLQMTSERVTDLEQELREVRKELFFARGWKAKRRALERENELRTQLQRALLDSGMPSAEAQQLATWNPHDSQRPAHFFDPEFMFGVDAGFDVVIGNPPYVRQERIKELKAELKKHYTCANGTADLFVYFYESAVKLLRPGGAISFITSNKYYKAGYGKELRKFLARELTLTRLVDFADAPVFEAIAYASILCGVRRNPSKTHALRYLKWLETDADSFAQLPAMVESKSADLFQSKLDPEGWTLESKEVLALLDKIRRAGTQLDEFVKGRFYYGIKTGFNEAFVVDRAKRDALIAEHPSSAELLKPFLRGRDVKRWKAESKDLWLLFVPWHFPLHEDSSISGASERAESLFRKGWPAIYRHLSSFRTQLEGRNAAETGIRYEWYALQRWASEYHKEFEEAKIIYPDMFQGRSFCWDDTGALLVNTLYFIAAPPKWLLGYLNSSVFEWFYRNISNQNRGGTMRAFSDKMQNVPVPSLSSAPDICRGIERLIDAATQGSESAEAEIDRLIFEACGLDSREIQLIQDDLRKATLDEPVEQIIEIESDDPKPIKLPKSKSVKTETVETKSVRERTVEAVPVAEPPDETLLPLFRKCLIQAEMPVDDLLRAVAREQGHQRLGAKIREPLEAVLRTAAHRGILSVRDGATLRLTKSLGDYELDWLAEKLPTRLNGSEEVELDELYRRMLEWLGFGRLTDNTREILEQALNKARRAGLLHLKSGMVSR